MTNKSKILILTKSVATIRVLPRISFISSTLQKAVSFHFNASSCSNSSLIAFQRQTHPSFFQMILVSSLFRKSLRHISPTTYGSIICNCRSLYDIIKVNKVVIEFLPTKNKNWKINYLYRVEKKREISHTTDKKRYFIV